MGSGGRGGEGGEGGSSIIGPYLISTTKRTFAQHTVVDITQVVTYFLGDIDITQEVTHFWG